MWIELFYGKEENKKIFKESTKIIKLIRRLVYREKF